MRIAGARFLAGPNIHDDSSGIVADTELTALPPAGQPLVIAAGRSDPVFAALGLAGMADAWAAAAARGRAALPGFLLRLATALVTPASIFPSGGRIVAASESRLVVFLRCEHEKTGLLAWDCAGKAVMACLPGEDGLASVQAAHAAFRRAASQLGADPMTTAVAREARRLDLPWYRLKIPGQHLQLGQGVHRRYLFEAMGDGSGSVSLLMSQDRFLTNRILGAAGVPVPPMMEVMSEAGAVAAAERLGYPVVVKPCHGEPGRGVSVRLATPVAVAAAYRLASAGEDSVVVEKFAAGHDHRILVLDGRVIGAARRTADEATGGTAVDVIDAMHPDNKTILERAAKAMELAIVGIDFLTGDIARPWRETGGVVLGLNALPGLGPHWLAHPGRFMVEPIIRSLLPPGADGRIPTCAITGTLGKTTTANMVARILGTMGLRAGRCTTLGVWVGDESLRTGDSASGWHARNLLFNRRVEAGVFELARGALLKDGMTIDDCDVGAVLNVLDEHIGMDGIRDRGDLAAIKSIVARHARRMLLLNAEDPLCLAMRPVARAQRLGLVGKDASAALLRDHAGAGGFVVTLRPSPDGDEILVIDHGVVHPVMRTTEIPATLHGRHGGKVWNAMFATGIAHAMGASLDHVRHGLRSFRPDIADAQGRLTVFDQHPFRVILDHATGKYPALELATLARKTAVSGRKLVCVMASAIPPDWMITATGEALAGAFDRYVCTGWSKRQRPDPHTVPGLLRDGLMAGGVPAADIVCIPSDDDGVTYVLGEARRGDLVVIISLSTEKAIQLIESFVADGAEPADGPLAQPG